MANNFLFVQAQNFSISGAGASLGDTSITLQSFTTIDGTPLTMANFGNIGFGTMEPGNGTLEEQICFTGVTQNTNGTATLTGVSSVAFISPYTQTSGLSKTHAGSTTFVISNTAGFYNKFVAKDDDGTISETLTFTVPNFPEMSDGTTMPTLPAQLATKAYADSLAIAGAPNASTSVKGILQLPTQAQVDAKTATGSTGAALAVTPADLRSTLTNDYVVDTGAANAYAIAPSPVITAYAVGQVFSFKAVNASTTASTLNVNGLGTKSIFNKGSALVGGEILAGQIVQVEYDGTEFQMVSPPANTLTPSSNITQLINTSLLAGESLTAGNAVAAGFYQSDGGVKFDAKTGNTGSGTTIGSPTITVGANSNRIVVIVLTTVSNTIGTPTIGGSNFTKIDGANSFNGGNSYWVGYFVAPSTGAQTLACTFGGSTAFAWAAYSYYNAQQSGQPDAHAVNTPNGATGSQAVTPVLPGTLLFGYYFALSNTSTTVPTLAGFASNTQSENGTTAVVGTGDNGIDPTIDAQTVSFSGASGENGNGIGSFTIAPFTAPSYGYVIKTSAANGASYAIPLATNIRLNFIGFVTNSPSVTQSASIVNEGIMTGLSGLSPAKTQFLSDTLGVVASSAGTNSRKVGISITSTTMDIAKEP